jgi:hypothetical protein
MANESESRLHSSVKIRDDGVILAQTPALVSVAHVPASGIYTLVYNEGIGDPEEVHELCVAPIVTGEDIQPRIGGVLKIDEFTYEVHTFAPVNPPPNVVSDASFSFTIWRVSSSNGT